MQWPRLQCKLCVITPSRLPRRMTSPPWRWCGRHEQVGWRGVTVLNRIPRQPAEPLMRQLALRMVKRFAVFRAYFLTLLAAIVVTASLPQAIAQQPPVPNAPSSVDPASTAPKNPKDGQPVDKTSNDVGKTKLEQQTGTKNDRIFEVLPNYGTVRSSKSLPQLTDRAKIGRAHV